jgi:hypothetical protein
MADYESRYDFHGSFKFCKQKAEKIINHTLKVGINGDIKEIHTDCTETVGE